MNVFASPPFDPRPSELRSIADAIESVFAEHADLLRAIAATLPVVLNPEAIGNPDMTPIVQLPPAMAAYFERTRCPECDLINHFHEGDCSRKPGETT